VNGAPARRTAVLTSLAAVSLLAALAAAGCGRSRSAAPEAPPTADVAGLRNRIDAGRGHPVLVSFWATWCRPCVEELPELVALQQSAQDPVHVVAVSLDGFLSGDAAPAVVGAFLKESPAALDHLVYKGTQDALFTAFDLPGSIPYSILYDETGTELRRFDGAASRAEIRAALAAHRESDDPGSSSGTGSL
jgi:thiol-disulfide isomerase/thioredoxin